MNSTVCCPRCGTKGAIPKEYIGKRIQCSHCKNEFTAQAVKTGKKRTMKLPSKIMLALCWVAAVAGIAFMVWPEVRESHFWHQVEKQMQNFARGPEKANNQTDEQLFPVGNPIAQNNNQPPADKLFLNQKVALAPPAGAAIETTVAKLVDAFKNPLAGQDKFGDKRVRITGFLYSGGLFTPTLRDIELKQGDDEAPTARCYMSVRQEEEKVLRLRGIKVTVEGICTTQTVYADIGLKDCRIVSDWTDLEKQIAKRDADLLTAQTLAAEKLEQEIRVSITVSSPQTTKKHDIVEVVGAVQNISPQLSDGNVHITVMPDPAIEYINEVHCKFRHVYRPQLVKLRPGDHVVIRGKGGDAQFSFNGTNLTNCVLIK